MKYFLIVGEASGDLHAAHLMEALRRLDADASFRFYGGDLMSRAGGVRLCHYSSLAYMGFVPVLLHLPRILAGMKRCQEAIRRWQPDAVILVDYPGFNLKMARYVHRAAICPVFYYISPKIWAWKEGRIKAIRRYVDRLFSILPFETDFFEKKHHYPVSYVGNPTVDEVAAFRSSYSESFEAFSARTGLDPARPVIALLAGSRTQEVRRNLLPMCRAALRHAREGYQLVVAAAPSLHRRFYESVLAGLPGWRQLPLHVVRDETYPLLAHATAALVTSGTATLETALLGVPQVVCYRTPCPRIVGALRRRLLHVRYVSLVNLVCDEEVVPELVADTMTPRRLEAELAAILPGGAAREPMLEGYGRMARRLGPPGAPDRAAREMAERLGAGRKG